MFSTFLDQFFFFKSSKHHFVYYVDSIFEFWINKICINYEQQNFS